MKRPGQKKAGKLTEYPVYFLFDNTIRVRGKLLTYSYFIAGSIRTAMLFLEQTDTPGPFQYLVVTTPEGKIGRDSEGIYPLKQGAMIANE